MSFLWFKLGMNFLLKIYSVQLVKIGNTEVRNLASLGKFPFGCIIFLRTVFAVLFGSNIINCVSHILMNLNIQHSYLKVTVYI